MILSTSKSYTHISLITLMICFLNLSVVKAQQTELSYDYELGLEMQPEPKAIEKLVCSIAVAPADSNSTIVLAIKENAQGSVIISTSFQLSKRDGQVYAISENYSIPVIDNNVGLPLILPLGHDQYLNKLIAVTITDKAGKSSVKQALLNK